MTSCNSGMAMTDDNQHSATAEAEYRDFEERVTESTICLSFFSCAGMSSYLRFLFFSRQVLIACFLNFFMLTYNRVIGSRCYAPHLKGILFVSPLFGVINAYKSRTMQIEHILWK